MSACISVPKNHRGAGQKKKSLKPTTEIRLKTSIYGFYALPGIYASCQGRLGHWWLLQQNFDNSKSIRCETKAAIQNTVDNNIFFLPSWRKVQVSVAIRKGISQRSSRSCLFVLFLASWALCPFRPASQSGCRVALCCSHGTFSMSPSEPLQGFCVIKKDPDLNFMSTKNSGLSIGSASIVAF